jgi:hypothetical protein
VKPRYGLDYIPKNEIEELWKCTFCWDFYGKHVYISENEEYEDGFQNNFFIMRPKGNGYLERELAVII